jgi:NAD(P)-dependent dehydrogenase (short-subunit alcohol dehydrogenase family)
MSRLLDKTIIVTGAAQGQGRAAALRLAEEGGRLALTDRDADGLEQTAAAVRAAGGEAVSHAGDISATGTCDVLVAAALGAFGRIDVLYNNAGIVIANTVDQYALADFDELMHVNCMSQLLMIQRVLPEMRRAKSGSIINVSSIGGLVALPHMSVYCASKAAVIGLTRGVAYECGDDNIRCNVICPGGVDTPMARAVVDGFDNRDEALRLLTGRQLFKRFARPEEIADLVVFLASDESSFITGAVIPIEAGHSAW